MHLSDALSCLSTQDNSDAKSKAKPIDDFNSSIHYVEEFSGFKYITLHDIKEAASVDV